MSLVNSRTGIYSYLILILVANIVKCIDDQSLSHNNEIPFYYFNSKPITIINKSNRISLINNRDVVIIDDKYDNEADQNTAAMPSLFKQLYSNDDYMLIGTRNKLFNITLDDLYNKESLNKKFTWFKKQDSTSSSTDCSPNNVNLNPYLCTNYVQAAIPIDDDLLITCVTNQNNPICFKHFLNAENQTRSIQMDSFKTLYNDNQKILKDLKSPLILTPDYKTNKQNIAPFKYLNSIYYFYSKSTKFDIFKQDINYRKSLTNTSSSDVDFKTVYSLHPGAIKNPNFRTSYGYKDKVLFYFTESNSEYNSDVSYKTKSPFIGQICVNDRGRLSPADSLSRFITFRKTLLYCYLPDYEENVPIRYNEIQEASIPIGVLNNGSRHDFIYTIFTITRANTIDSALCMFNLTEVDLSMNGFFKDNPKDSKYVKPHESCDKFARLNKEQQEDYFKDITKHYKFQMERTVNERALFSLNNVKFTSITVDPSPTLNKNENIIFVGTNDGRVLKLIIRAHPTIDGHQQPIILAEYQIFNKTGEISSIRINTKSGTKHLIVVSNKYGVKSVPLDVSCESYTTCQKCSNSLDPNCNWSNEKSKCIFTSDNSKSFTSSSICKPDDETESPIYQILTTNNLNNNNNNQGIFNEYQSIDEQTNDPTSNRLINHVSALPSISSASTSPSYLSTILILILILFTSLLTMFISILITLVVIRKNYYIKEKYMYDIDKSRHGKSSSIINNLSKILIKRTDRYDNDTDDYSDNSNNPKYIKHKMQTKQKILNCYEKSNGGPNESGNMKPVTVLCTRPISSDSPMTTTTSSSLGSNNNSPNNLSNQSANDDTLAIDDNSLLTPSKYDRVPSNRINDTSLSSSNDSFTHKLLSSERYKKNLNFNTNLLSTDTGNNSSVTTNLLMNRNLN